jgi:hypothetical protein
MRGGHADGGKRADGVGIGAFDGADDDGFHFRFLTRQAFQTLSPCKGNDALGSTPS